MGKDSLDSIAKDFGINQDQLKALHAKARQAGKPLSEGDLHKLLEESIRSARRMLELSFAPPSPECAQLIDDMWKKHRAKK